MNAPTEAQIARGLLGGSWTTFERVFTANGGVDVNALFNTLTARVNGMISAMFGPRTVLGTSPSGSNMQNPPTELFQVDLTQFSSREALRAYLMSQNTQGKYAFRLSGGSGTTWGLGYASLVDKLCNEWDKMQSLKSIPARLRDTYNRIIANNLMGKMSTQNAVATRVKNARIAKVNYQRQLNTLNSSASYYGNNLLAAQNTLNQANAGLSPYEGEGGLIAGAENELQALVDSHAAESGQTVQTNTVELEGSAVVPSASLSGASLSRIANYLRVRFQQQYGLMSTQVEGMVSAFIEKLTQRHELGDAVQFTDEERALINDVLEMIAGDVQEIEGEISAVRDEIAALQSQLSDIYRQLSYVNSYLNRLRQLNGRVITSVITYKTVVKDGRETRVTDQQISFFGSYRTSSDPNAKPEWVKLDGESVSYVDHNGNTVSAQGKVTKKWEYDGDGKLVKCTEAKKEWKTVTTKVKVTVDDGCGQSHTETRNGVKQVQVSFDEVTAFDGNERAISVSRNGQVVGTFSYDKFGRLTESVYNDINGMKTTTTFDPALGRPVQSVTEGDYTYMMEDISYFEDEYGKKVTGDMAVTVHVRTVTTYDYNDTSGDLGVNAKDGANYTVRGGGLITATSKTRTTGSFSYKTGEWYYKMDVTNKIKTKTTEINYFQNGEEVGNKWSKTVNQSTTISDETLATKIWWTVIDALISVALIVVSVVLTAVTMGAGALTGVAATAGTVGLVLNIVDMWNSMADVDVFTPDQETPTTDRVTNAGYEELSLRPPVEPPKAPLNPGPMINPTNTGWGMR